MAFARWLEHLPWVVELTGNAVEISIVWLFHFLGFILAVGTTVIIDLRILGLAGRSATIGQLAKLFTPWTWLGAFLALLSGFLMFAGYAVQEYPAGIFRFKVVLFFLAVIFGYIVESNGPKWDRFPTAPGSAKLLALVSMVLWIGLILASVEVPAYIACI
jgi:hypothetical protein